MIITSMCWHPGGRMFTTGFENGLLVHWDLNLKTPYAIHDGLF